METKILNGRILADQIQLSLKNEITTLSHIPHLAVVFVGNNPASSVYVNMKTKVAEKVGIKSTIHHLDENISTKELQDKIHQLNNDKDVDGILVQLPLPAHIDTNTIIETIAPQKDADGLTSKNQGGLMTGYPTLLPCTPLGCLHLIKQVQPNLTGLNAVVVGRSRLVGRPMAQLLLNENCSVTQVHTYTQNLADICATADILVSATGVQGLIKSNFVKAGAIVIDVGISKTKEGLIAGDIDSQSVMGKAGWLTPVPGGVGPMTVAMLMSNMVTIVKNQS